MSEPRPKLLVVDDDPEILELLRVRLEYEGFEVRAFPGGQQALTGVADWVPDAAVVDFMMPGLHGFALVRELRADPRMTGARIVILSAKGYGPDREAARKVGADAYLVKPIDFKTLLSVLRGEEATSA